MTLPKAQNKKLIKEKEFVKTANEVRKSFEEKAKYLHEKQIKTKPL